MKEKSIYVTQPFLPPLSEFIPYLEEIWESKILTNAGPYHQKLEQELSGYLGVDHISLFTNGTIALLTALRSANLTGEIITTPYTFVATVNSLIWSGLKPVFVDINPQTFNIDPHKICEVINEKTSAIMPVHCYGHPCDVAAISKIADEYKLKVIYDAAHAFGVNDEGGSILRHGDLSVISFHATKVFNTFEGGAIVSSSLKKKRDIDLLRNFGIVNETTVEAIGINGKLNELQSSFGLLQLRYANELKGKRKLAHEIYVKQLRQVRGIKIINHLENIDVNYSYFPIIVEDEFPVDRDSLYTIFTENNIFVRRYFYPLISELPNYKYLPSASRNNLQNAYKISSQVLCLPMHSELTEEEIGRITEIIRKC